MKSLDYEIKIYGQDTLLSFVQQLVFDRSSAIPQMNFIYVPLPIISTWVDAWLNFFKGTFFLKAIHSLIHVFIGFRLFNMINEQNIFLGSFGGHVTGVPPLNMLMTMLSTGTFKFSVHPFPVHIHLNAHILHSSKSFIVV